METRIGNIDWETVGLMETLSFHDQTYSAVGYNDRGHKYIGTAIVSCGEIVEIIDIEIG